MKGIINMSEFECIHTHNDIKLLKEIAALVPESETIDKLSEFFKAFSDPGRLKIIQALSQNNLCVCEISQIVNMSQSAVSHQLRYLKNINILSCKREGKSIIYSLKDNHILHIYLEGLIHINEDKEV